jgi:hypothetical protein
MTDNPTLVTAKTHSRSTVSRSRDRSRSHDRVGRPRFGHHAPPLTCTPIHPGKHIARLIRMDVSQYGLVSQLARLLGQRTIGGRFRAIKDALQELLPSPVDLERNRKLDTRAQETGWPEELVSALYGGTYHRSFKGEKKSAEEEDVHAYPYIASNHWNFILGAATLRQYLPTKNPRFIDVGCGIGDKVILASMFGMEASGIELNQDTAAFAGYITRLIGLDDDRYDDWDDDGDDGESPQIIRGNAFAHNFSPYNLVYTYLPSSDRDVLARLYDHCMTTMQNGAILWEIAGAHYSASNLVEYGWKINGKDDPYLYKRLDDGVFEEITSQVTVLVKTGPKTAEIHNYPQRKYTRRITPRNTLLDD